MFNIVLFFFLCFGNFSVSPQDYATWYEKGMESLLNSDANNPNIRVSKSGTFDRLAKGILLAEGVCDAKRKAAYGISDSAQEVLDRNLIVATPYLTIVLDEVPHDVAKRVKFAPGAELLLSTPACYGDMGRLHTEEGMKLFHDMDVLGTAKVALDHFLQVNFLFLF